MIGIFTVVTTIQHQKLSTQQHEQDKQDAFLLRQHSEWQAENTRKENVFTTYLDDVSKLSMLENNTMSLAHIRMKTLTSLRQLDSVLKSHLLLFLYENEFIFKNSQVPSSPLLKVNGADFNEVHFQGTREARCSFIGLYLHDVHLWNGSFINCKLWFSDFSKSIMYNTIFANTDLRGSSFKLALLDKGNFTKTNLIGVTFAGASLIECDFSGARVTRGKVNFMNANLSGAVISKELLHNATLSNCVLPNGTWAPIIMENLIINGDVEQIVSLDVDEK
ncbi:unnamed protein product [Adineta steineri]|uniref:Pentapeptide repeat-containing protein n=1 Tax=Adineta steineri TaxID=433720 RepID=A0A813V615_9BILA|nr:unnamed protein product [Adineta steineri]CAF4103709.1 unnamed protein product [Adineta steineri]